MKRTYQPSQLVRKRRHGFRSRMATVGGRKIINARRARGRAKLSAQYLRLPTIKKSSEFSQIRNKGIFYKSPSFNGFLLKDSSTEKFVLGIVASKRLGNAVERNRAKRRTREFGVWHDSFLPHYPISYWPLYLRQIFQQRSLLKENH